MSPEADFFVTHGLVVANPFSFDKDAFPRSFLAMVLPPFLSV